MAACQLDTASSMTLTCKDAQPLLEVGINPYKAAMFLEKDMQKNTLWFNGLSMDDVDKVGGKNASLGEMVSNLAMLAYQYQTVLRPPLMRLINS